MILRRVLVWQASKKITTLGAAELQEKRHSLRRRIDAWRTIQQLYMPCIEQVRSAASENTSNASHSSSTRPSTPDTASDTPSSVTEQPETTPLFLPSAIPSSFWSTGCASGLVDKERRLRLAQADDALNELRRQLRISATLLDFKKVQVGGGSQKMNTRTRSLMSRFWDKTMRCAEQYNAAYQALLTLDPNGNWTARLKVLDYKTDLRSPRRDDDDDSRETRRELSWIWLTSREGAPLRAVSSADEINDSKPLTFIIVLMFEGSGAAAVNDFDFKLMLIFICTAMRVEWAKTKARADRWGEEVLLVIEEMRRSICFLEWKANWWLEQADLRSDAPLRVQRGISAYASKQAAVCRSMAMLFATRWYPILKKQNILIEWPSQYIPRDPAAMDVD